MKKGANNLGRGLAALLGDDIDSRRNETQATTKDTPAGPTNGLINVAIEKLAANPSQPRKIFDEAALEELSRSIKKNGILQPIVVTPTTDIANDSDAIYTIVAGERRWRAAQRAGLNEVVVIVKKFDEKQRAELTIVENIQREDLSPLELAEAYLSLIERFNYRQEDLAEALGKSRSTITNSLRLLTLAPSIKEKLTSGKISEGHARLLVGLNRAEAMAETFVKKSMSVRQAEKTIQNLKKSDYLSDKTNKSEKNPNISALEQEIEEILGLKAQIEHSKSDKGDGKITIFYRNVDQLEPFLEKIRKK